MSRPRLTLIVNNDVPCDQRGTSADQASWSNQLDTHALKVSAPGAVRRMADIEMRAGRGDHLSMEDESFRARRSEALQKCREIAGQAQRGAAA